MPSSFNRRAGMGAVSVLCAAFMTSSAAAETLPVAGIYPADNDGAAALNSIAVENFGGDKGVSLSFAITDRLENVVIDGERYFALYPDDHADVDGVLRGSATIEVSETDADDKEIKRCEERDEKRKCIKERKVYAPCWNLRVTLFPDIRLTAANGNSLYRNRNRPSKSERYCSDEDVPSVESMSQSLIDRLASEIRYDLAPVYRNQAIRVMESRKGMNKGDQRAFREAVKLTKTDIGKACLGFGALESTNPQNVSILFNIGLCAEGRGDLEAAASYYQRALAVEPGKDYPIWGLQRIEDRYRADQQLAAHYGA